MLKRDHLRECRINKLILQSKTRKSQCNIHKTRLPSTLRKSASSNVKVKNTLIIIILGLKVVHKKIVNAVILERV